MFCRYWRWSKCRPRLLRWAVWLFLSVSEWNSGTCVDNHTTYSAASCYARELCPHYLTPLPPPLHTRTHSPIIYYIYLPLGLVRPSFSLSLSPSRMCLTHCPSIHPHVLFVAVSQIWPFDTWISFWVWRHFSGKFRLAFSRLTSSFLDIANAQSSMEKEQIH